MPEIPHQLQGESNEKYLARIANKYEKKPSFISRATAAIKTKFQENRKVAAENRAYNQIINKRILQERRQAYEKAAIEATRNRAIINANRRFNPPPVQRQIQPKKAIFVKKGKHYIKRYVKSNRPQIQPQPQRSNPSSWSVPKW
jgi:hypothetical protein